MARATSGLGQFRGKVGSVVFRVNQGQQIASAYQPAVRNPKSNLQTAQRNKMYLASQLSKLVPREDIIGLAPQGSARDRRNIFIKNILDNSVSRLDGEVFESSVFYDGVMFSKGNDIEGITTEMSNSVNGGLKEFTIKFDKEIITEDVFNRLAFKVIQFDVLNGAYANYKSSWLDLGAYNNEDSETTFAKVFSAAVSEDVSTVVYIVPVELNANVRYSSEKKTLVQGDDNSFVILGQYEINNAVLKWYKSKLVLTNQGAEVYPPITGGDSVVNPDGPSFPNLG